MMAPSILISLCLFLSLSWSQARILPADEGAVERWELPEGAAYKNTMPLIGIFTQPCHGCPGKN